MIYECDLSCFKALREKMRQLQINMYPFKFNYLGNKFFVAAYCISKNERTELTQYALFHLIFMKQGKLDDTYELYINSREIMEFDLTKLRNYFGIEFDSKGISFLYAFCCALSTQCPPDIESFEDEELLKVEKYSLCKKLGVDPDHCYRLAIMRLPQPHKRNPNRYQLALRIFPNASKQYKNAMDVTYRFTANPDEEVSEEIAIERFIKNEQKRKSKHRNEL